MSVNGHIVGNNITSHFKNSTTRPMAVFLLQMRYLIVVPTLYAHRSLNTIQYFTNGRLRKYLAANTYFLSILNSAFLRECTMTDILAEKNDEHEEEGTKTETIVERQLQCLFLYFSSSRAKYCYYLTENDAKYLHTKYGCLELRDVDNP